MDDDILMGEDHKPVAPQPTRRPVGPRLYHKKSRMGCLRCKTRRVKCDEARPACGGCSRHQVDCVYPTNASASSSSSSRGRAQHSHQRADDAAGAGISLRVTRADSSSGHSDPAFSPNPSTASVLAGSEIWAHSPAPERPYMPLPGEPSGFSPMTPGHTPYSAAQGPSPPPHPGGYPSSSGPTVAPSSRAPSVISSSPSSHTGSIIREANDYLSHLTDPEILDIPESKERRIWELRLMHNYMVNLAQQFLGMKAEKHHGRQPIPSIALDEKELEDREVNQFPPGAFLWGREIPLLGFEDDAILYSMLASSALNMWTKADDPRERDQLRLFQQKYLSMALREQRQAVGNLSKENADNVCLSSLTILQNSFALVQTLPGAGAVLTVARGYLGFGGDDKITRFINSMPRMDPDEMFTPEKRAHLTWVLDNDRGSTDVVGDHELQDKVTLGIYNRVLSYVGSVQQAIADQEPLYAICRRFIGFAVWMPELYHDFLTQMRPRALITLAHFFKLWIPYDDLWLIGKTGENQVRGIQEALPPQWKHKLDSIFEEYHLEP
ncbi:Sterol uptake control protein 2 [Cytospora mali]|uniref:Sterol uptake control protein 2 n=1 Tax=Cytospora mali TaxID=578113 RepID=A0A194UM04_CYTMA|nr:Sterol uptake control protein 2 [Valsa mali var. pyri (nom. inval.)]